MTTVKGCIHRDEKFRLRLLNFYAFSVMLYGCESSTLDLIFGKRVEAIELYTYRRILRIL